MSLGHSWCCALPLPVALLKFCWFSPGPGGFFQDEYLALETGARAFGIGSGSLNGDRISGLVGKTSVYSESAKAIEVTPNTPLGELRPRLAREGSVTSRPKPRPKAAAPAALILRTVRRDTWPWSEVASWSMVDMTLL